MSAQPECTGSIESHEIRWPWSRFTPHLSERRILLVTVDLLVLNAILAGRLLITGRIELVWSSLGQNMVWFLVFNLLWSTIASALEAYELTVAAVPFESIFHTVQAYLVTTGIYLLIPIAAPPFDRQLVWFGQVGGSLLALAVWRLIYAHLIIQPIFRRRVMIIGAGSAGRIAVGLLRHHATANHHIVGFIDDDPGKQDTVIEGIGVLGPSDDLLDLAARTGATDIVLAISHTIRPQLFATLLRCQEQGYIVAPLPILYEELSGRMPVAHLDRDWWTIWQNPPSPLRRLYRSVKRLVDLVVALLALGLIALPGLLIALAIRLDSPGPIFYRQTRIGRGGRPITVTKFRTMIASAEADGRPRWAQAGDERITRVGRWLRRARLDEWPQFLNLLDGTMALIGPRPERPAFVEQLNAEIPCYQARHLVRPGLTGWAQVQYQYGQSVDDARIKLEYDLYYIKHEGPYLDLLVLIRTVRAVLRLEGR
ncbi:MAG: sugar transferase [Ardenticatenaceae bacterium]|nr:sugar transferase [Ardenticatenaceae bacterium]HBY92801.1 hypothetical protein [Chloroflexota bacterium]